MGRRPIGERAMTTAERQRRLRNAMSETPMTKTEREELGRLISYREKVLKAAARQRSAELLAEFEQQMASIYAYDQDETWKAATNAAEGAVSDAQKVIAARFLGLPKRGKRTKRGAPNKTAARNFLLAVEIQKRID